MKKVRKVILILVGVIAALFLIIAIAMGAKMREIQKSMESVETVSIDMSKVKDGSYTADTDLGLVKVKVEVMVEAHQIKTIEILEHQNGKGKPAEAIIDEMIEKNTDEVDAISGATCSSVAIRSAVNKALQEGLEK
ncbi:MAG: FMN-binding protein [Lachnospiraceae bacterium]|nr:FMN-binding protein [Lachnospiraceae bacterium]